MSEIITPREAAKILDVSTQAVYRLIARGTLVATGENTRTLRRADVEARLTLPSNGNHRQRTERTE